MRYFHVRKAPFWRGAAAGLAAFAAVAALGLGAAVKTRQKAAQEGAALLRQAVTQGAVACYAVEGRYPPDLQYLIDNCGLLVDTETYLVSYNVYGENLLPDVRVYLKGD